MSEQRIIVWVSAGLASAVAWRLAKNQYGDRVLGVYCDTSKTESPDNPRFLKEVSEWVGSPLTVIKSDKYATVDEVFEKRRYLAGIKGAPCTVEMKKVPRFGFQQADDIHIFGLTYEEQDRKAEFAGNNPDMIINWILIDNKVTRKDCIQMVESAGIALPERYAQGFDNNNCECCVKASSVLYWVLSRRLNPETFKRRCDQSRRFGARLVRYKLPGMANAKRIFLDELPPDEQIVFRGKPLPAKWRAKEKITCGAECAG